LFSIVYNPEKTRGHVSLLTFGQMEKEFLPLKLKEKKFVQTPSKTINIILPQWEGIAMYAFFVFEK